MKRFPVTGLRSALVWGALVFAGCATSVPVPRPPELAARVSAPNSREAGNLRVFDAVWSRVQSEFHDPRFRGADWSAAALKYGPRAAAAVDDRQLYNVLNEMLGELKESHNYASSAKEVAEKPLAPQARVGLVLGRLENRWVVTQVVPGSPAHEAGVKQGWLLVSRNGRTLGPGRDFAVKAGEPVTDVYLDAADRSHTVTLVPRPISVTALRHARVLEGGVVYLRFDQFDRPSRRWLSEQLKLHREAPGVILDLRYNPGGTAFSLAVTVGEFFPQAVSWGRFTGRDAKPEDNDSWQWGSARYAGRVAVLVGPQTASSAEILARALQYHRRAVVVGRTTAGAVIGSVDFGLPNGGRLQVGVVDYEAPDGQRLEGVGVKPDIAVKSTFDGLAGLRAGRDRDLEAALAALQSPPATPVASTR